MPSQDVPTARDIMTRSLITLRPEQPISEAIAVLLAHNISGAPVVNAEGRLLGLLSEFDCLRDLASDEYYEDGNAEATTVADRLSQVSHTIPPELDLYGIAHEFVTLRVRRLPVVEADRVVGQVSRRDVLRAIDRMRRGRRRHKRYPDYPEDRRPIHDYPDDR
jgi:CBS domain-containing protein